ncbi:Tn3 family transposase [Actinomadura fulvescens]|uniref:Tn3 family transposase n=1 Tax=Actinomadura fulvescens TaxID=46160 RepID=UPI00397DA382
MSYRPTPDTRYAHIDTLFGDEAIDWRLIETQWSDLLSTPISIRQNRISSVTLLRRLGNHCRKNRLYRAFRELGRTVRTITLLRYLSDPDLRERITQVWRGCTATITCCSPTARAWHGCTTPPIVASPTAPTASW